MRRPWLWVVAIVVAGLIFYGLAELAGQAEPTVTLTEVPSPTPTPHRVVICQEQIDRTHYRNCVLVNASP